MEYLNQSVKEVSRPSMLQHIELCGRVCYKSEDKITPYSALKFVNNISNLGHTSVLEHGSVYLVVDKSYKDGPLRQDIERVMDSKYTNVRNFLDEKYKVYTNLRVLKEVANELYNMVVKSEELPDYIKYFMPDKNDIYRRLTFNIITDRRIETELVRHRIASFSIESTRYCNYSKKGMSFIDIRKWCSNWKQKFWWKLATKFSEFFYNRMIACHAKPEIARSVLLSSNKADVMMTASISDWVNVIKLREDKHAHPQVREIAKEIKSIMLKKEYAYDSWF